METNYSVQHFIDKFEAIPEQDWCINDFMVDKSIRHHPVQKLFGKKDITHYTYCAQGHCMPKEHIPNITSLREVHSLTDIAKSYPEWDALVQLFGIVRIEKQDKLVIARINNGYDKRYLQPTPKQRVLAALYNLKKEHDKTTTTETKDPKTVYVSITKEVKELTKDVVEN